MKYHFISRHVHKVDSISPVPLHSAKPFTEGRERCIEALRLYVTSDY